MADYKGIPYHIEKISHGEWLWSINPTTSVRGLRVVTGRSTGTISAVNDLVKNKIDGQVRELMNRSSAP